jgi:hypothetical protein
VQGCIKVKEFKMIENVGVQELLVNFLACSVKGFELK